MVWWLVLAAAVSGALAEVRVAVTNQTAAVLVSEGDTVTLTCDINTRSQPHQTKIFGLQKNIWLTAGGSSACGTRRAARGWSAPCSTTRPRPSATGSPTEPG